MMVNNIEICGLCFDDQRLLPTIFTYLREIAYATLPLSLAGISVGELVLNLDWRSYRLIRV